MYGPRILKLDLAGGEGLILHDHGAAGGQDHDVELLLPLMGLLVPVAGHLRVVGGDEGHLGPGKVERHGERRGTDGTFFIKTYLMLFSNSM